MAQFVSKKALISGSLSTLSEVSISYILHDAEGEQKGSILLLHGYPETNYQYRHVIPQLAKASFRVIAPDYRGAGHSSKPSTGYDKAQMAADIHQLLTRHIGIIEKVHVIGHDIGGMIAYAYASRYPEHTASVAPATYNNQISTRTRIDTIQGEFPLPGTIAYENAIRDNSYGCLWHFIFHWQMDLPEALTAGRERVYIEHFYRRLSHNSSAFTKDDVGIYESLYSTSGAMRAGFELYRAFHEDTAANRSWFKANGKSKVPCLALNGKESLQASSSESQCYEVFENVDTVQIEASGHFVAEENCDAFVQAVIAWVGKF